MGVAKPISFLFCCACFFFFVCCVLGAVLFSGASHVLAYHLACDTADTTSPAKLSHARRYVGSIWGYQPDSFVEDFGEIAIAGGAGECMRDIDSTCNGTITCVEQARRTAAFPFFLLHRRSYFRAIGESAEFALQDRRCSDPVRIGWRRCRPSLSVKARTVVAAAIQLSIMEVAGCFTLMKQSTPKSTVSHGVWWDHHS